MSDKSNWLIRLGLFGIVGLVFLGLGLYKLIPTWKEPVDLFNMELSELNNRDHVKFEVEYVLGCAVSVETQTTRNGSVVKKEETSRIYIIPELIVADDGYVDIGNYYLVEVGKKDFAKMENLYNRFWDWYDYDYEKYGWLYSETDYNDIVYGSGSANFLVDGVLAKTEAKERSYAKDALLTMGDDNESIDQYLLADLKIDATANGGTPFAIMGAIFAVIGVVGILLVLKKSKQEAENAYGNTAANGAYGATATYTGNYGGTAYGNGATGTNGYGDANTGYNGTGAANTGYTGNTAYGNTGVNYGAGSTGNYGGYNYSSTGAAGNTAAAKTVDYKMPDIGSDHISLGSDTPANTGVESTQASTGESLKSQNPFSSGMFSAYNPFEEQTSADNSQKSSSTINLNGVNYDPSNPDNKQ